MPNSTIFTLEVSDFVDADHWRWILKDSNGNFLADHQVAIDKSDAMYPALLDLYDYLKRNAIPDKWPEDEIRLINAAGQWISERILGSIAQRLASEANPTTVRVVLPPEAVGIMYSPLDVARPDRKSLAERDISFVFEIAGEEHGKTKASVGTRLRMLSIFSLPTDVSALGLRRERYELKRLITRISQTHDVGIELRILQYGTTRKALQQALEEGEGWDVIHFSGHGLRAGLMLEKADGTYDLLTGVEFAELLQPTRGQLKLVTLSSCLSAAATVRETMQWLGLKLVPDTNEKVPRGELVALAREIVRQLGCAVIAMRYPVGDDFAIAFGSEVYDKLLGKRQQLTRACQLALRSTLATGYRPGVPPISAATPALFGDNAVSLSITAPPSLAQKVPAERGFSSVPREPAHFVGRIGPMSRASSAMAPESGNLAVMFHGMAGAGKTYCAVELTYRYELGRFQHFIWYKAPDEGNDIEGELQRLTIKLESGIPGLKIVESLNKAGDFSSALPSLRHALEQRSVLVVLDNVESLLAADGAWRDSRWKDLLATLLGHSGNSRLIITTRRRPSDLEYGHALLVENIDVLTLSESVLLAHELPNLGQLLRGHPKVDLPTGRLLVERVLSVVQGHPKLIDFAEGQARDPEVLARNLDRATAAWDLGQEALRAFFETGESAVTESAFLKVLDQWTHQISISLSLTSRMLLHFLCSLEESDRDLRVLVDTWPAFVQVYRSGEDIPAIGVALESLVAGALVQEQIVEPDVVRYSIHPAIAEAAKSEVDKQFADTVDFVLGEYWVEVFNRATKQELEGFGPHVIRAGLSAPPYLIRRKEWFAAAQALEGVIIRDRSPSTLATVIPLQRRIVKNSKGSKEEIGILGSLANSLLMAERLSEAEALARKVLEESERQGDYRTAGALAGRFAETLVQKGEFELAAVFRQKEVQYISHANLGPWSQLIIKTRVLRELNARGACQEVISILNDGVLEYMESLPDDSGQREGITAWQVREGIYDIAHTALLGSEQWEGALQLNGKIQAVMTVRGATALDLAYTAFNDYSPLLRLGRIDDARTLLRRCRERFEAANAVSMLGKLFSALSSVEYSAQNLDQSITLEETALRYKYLSSDAETCGVSHFNIANRLFFNGSYTKSLAHRLASALIAFQMNSGRLPDRIRILALSLSKIETTLPAFVTSFDELCKEVEKVQGVKFRNLFDSLPRRVPTGDQALAEVIRLARALGPSPFSA